MTVRKTETVEPDMSFRLTITAALQEINDRLTAIEERQTKIDALVDMLHDVAQNIGPVLEQFAPLIQMFAPSVASIIPLEDIESINNNTETVLKPKRLTAPIDVNSA